MKSVSTQVDEEFSSMHSSIKSLAQLNRLLLYIELDPDNPVLRNDAIREAFDTGYWEVARKLIDSGLSSHTADPELFALSGFSFLQALRYADAEQALSMALAQGLVAPEVHYNLAFAQFMQRRYSQALERLSTPPLPEGLPMAFVLRARCLHHLERRAEAIADCRAHLGSAPADAEANGLLALLLYEQGESECAREHARVALEQDPRQVEALLCMASVQFDSQEFDTAALSFESLLQAHPDCGRAWLGLGLLKLNDLQLDPALQAIELATTHMPDHIGTWHVLAWTQIMRGDVAAAEIAFNRALAVDRNFGETHGGLAVIAAFQGREDDARAGLKRALRLDPQSMSAYYAEMLLLQRHGKHKEAQELLDTFMARPVAQSDMQYRDLVAMHMKYLKTRSGTKPEGVALH
jgi:tetratricopeptide (TPR) repeat protein